MENGTSGLWVFSSAIIVAAATAWFAFIRYGREQKHQRRTLLNSLFAELINIYQHYSFATYELPTDSSNKFKLEKHLKWSKYGKVLSATDIGKLGFLNAVSVKDLLQLQLLIRNDDLLIEQLLENEENRNTENLSNLKSRLKDRVGKSGALLNVLIEQHPELKPVFEDMRKELPSIESTA